LSFPKDADNRETLNRLGAMGYRKPLEVSATVRRWLTGAYPSLRGEFARTQFTELVPVLLDRLGRAENPDVALNAFDLFLGGLQRGARLFSLLKQNPDLVTLVALTLGTAPRLADILARYPEAMDALLEPTFFGALPDEAKLEAELARTIKEARSYEDFLDRLRMFSQEQMFLVGARVLSDTVSAEQAGGAFARSPMSRSGRCTAGWRYGRRQSRPHPAPADRTPCARQARRPRDDGDVRSRPHHRLRF
jgi:glutamate-ammonia-ligase adenylyltransferase